MRNGAFMGNAISVQKKSTGFMIFTQKMREKYENEGMDYSIGNIHFMDNLTADEYLEMNQKRGNKDIMCFDTLEELCEGMGISDKLIETVKEYNQNIKEMKGDPIFHKNYKYLTPIEGGKYYVAKFRRHAYGVMGGLKINYKAEIQDVNCDSIPGLYGAGNDVNSIYGYISFCFIRQHIKFCD